MDNSYSDGKTLKGGNVPNLIKNFKRGKYWIKFELERELDLLDYSQ